MQTLASKMYGQVQHRTAADRNIELALFEQITEALESSVTEPGIANVARIDAISRDVRLWSLLSADLLSPENHLPTETKRSLLGLSEFVRREGMARLADNDSLEDLISINRTIMAGLGANRPKFETAEGV
jgi:flagellar biosynthesis activator protein FlaF